MKPDGSEGSVPFAELASHLVPTEITEITFNYQSGGLSQALNRNCGEPVKLMAFKTMIL